MNGADLLVRELQARGVAFVSVLCGNGLNPLLAAADRAGLRLVDTRNEQAASYIADAYARLTGRVGVCAVSSGVAHVNALAGVLNAHFDGAPMLLITGASSSAGLGRGAFQDLDQVALARPICKYAELVGRPERIPQAVHEAFAAATSGRPGPTHLTIPEDILSAEVQEAVEQFTKLTRIPFVAPIWDRGAADHPSEAYLGVIGAATGEPEILSEADVILLAGARVDYRVRYLDSPPLSDGLRVIRIDVDPGELHQGFEPDVAILADPRTAFQQLASAWERAGYTDHGDWLTEARRDHQEFYSHWASISPASTGTLTGGHIVEALRSVITDDALFLIDGGTIGQWAHMSLCNDRYPGHWLTCGASGVVGWGVPGAMGARLAFPDRPVLLLSGDGAIGFGIAEFESASRQKIPFVAVLADDQAWGIVVSGQRRSLGDALASELGPVDYAQVAQGFGARAVRVESPDQIPSAVREGFDSGRPTLIHVPIAIHGPEESL
jgi:acetolactate synthase-1/2/3 large subunit